MSERITYVEYDHPGMLVPERSGRVVMSRDPQLAADEAPASAYAFTFYDVIVTTVDGVELRSAPQTRSGRYLIGGEVLSAEAVEQLPGDHTVLLDNMRIDRWSHVVRCRTGNFQPFDDGVTVVNTSGGAR